MSLRQFLYMDGYGLYVWPSYAVAMTVLIANVIASRRALRRATAEAKRRLKITSMPSSSAPSGEDGRS